MVELSIERGDSFRKAGSKWTVWVVEKFILKSEPTHVELVNRDDPTTRITVSVGALANPRFFQRLVLEPQ